MTGNLQADGVQSRQTLFVRYCLISFMFLFRRLYVRQTHFELRIGMFLTADTDLCVVQVNDFFRNIQPQPQSGFVLTAGGIGLVESFKDFRQFFFGNTVSGIAYCKYPAVFLVCKGERDRAACRIRQCGYRHSGTPVPADASAEFHSRTQ